jgi:hypothetical protein
MNFKIKDKVILLRNTGNFIKGDIGIIEAIRQREYMARVKWKIRGRDLPWWVCLDDIKKYNIHNHPYTNVFMD